MEELSGYNLFHMNTRNLIISPTQIGKFVWKAEFVPV